MSHGIFDFDARGNGASVASVLPVYAAVQVVQVVGVVASSRVIGASVGVGVAVGRNDEQEDEEEEEEEEDDDEEDDDDDDDDDDEEEEEEEEGASCPLCLEISLWSPAAWTLASWISVS